MCNCTRWIKDVKCIAQEVGNLFLSFLWESKLPSFCSRTCSTCLHTILLTCAQIFNAAWNVPRMIPIGTCMWIEQHCLKLRWRNEYTSLRLYQFFWTVLTSKRSSFTLYIYCSDYMYFQNWAIVEQTILQEQFSILPLAGFVPCQCLCRQLGVIA